MSNIETASYGDFGMSEAAQRRRRLAQSLANQQAAFMGQTRGQRRISDITRQYNEGFRPQQAEFGRRGLGGPNVRSGIRQRGLQRYAEQFQRDLGDESLALQQELNNIAMLEAGGQADLDSYLNELRASKAQQIMDAAAALSQYTGY
jgi:hypothetical protein